MAKKPLPPFLSKLMVREEQDRLNERAVKRFDFLPLFEGLHREYKIDYDPSFAKYFRALIISNGCEIYDEDCFVANLPPMDRRKRTPEYLSE